MLQSAPLQLLPTPMFILQLPFLGEIDAKTSVIAFKISPQAQARVMWLILVYGDVYTYMCEGKNKQTNEQTSKQDTYQTKKGEKKKKERQKLFKNK